MRSAFAVGLILVLASVGGSTSPATQDVKRIMSAECRRVFGPIKLDGIVDEPAWQMAQAISEFGIGGTNRAARSHTTAKLLWDDDYLYFSAEMVDHDLYADVKNHNGMTWTNDVIELFLKPSESRRDYYEFQTNALNTQLELWMPSRGSGGYQRFGPITRFGMKTAVHLDGTLNDPTDEDKGWSAEWRIPWSAFKAIGGKPKVGDVWRFTVCRYDYSKDYEREELSSISNPGFHTYESYAELRFVK